MKSRIERRRESDGERAQSRCPNSWCKPIGVQDEAFGMAAMRCACRLGADTLIAPGSFDSFPFAVNRADACVKDPCGEKDGVLLREKLKTVRGKEFFQA